MIELSDNKGGFGLGYDPFNEELFQAYRGKKRKCIGQEIFQGMSIPHIRFTFLAPAEAIRSEVVQESHEEDSNLASLIHLCLKEFSMNAMISLRDDLTSTIQPCVSGETAGHWTIKLCFMVASTV